MSSLESLRFENTVLQQLPLDESRTAGVRQVRGAIYSLVHPTPLSEPQLVVVSHDALALLGLEPSEASRPEFTQVMAGNKVLSQQGSRPAAHCYAGYQFGYFAGQLGDGAAIYLGEVVPPSDSSSSSRQELQLKGAGLTPFSRQADGRKVLRSSMREFLASEAMHALGIPTTRAGSLVVSGSDKVVRDVTYSGNPSLEPCAVVSRIAPTFLRFGSFEVCKPPDPNTGRAGPSAGMTNQLLLPLVGYVIKHHHPDVWSYYGGGDDISMTQLSGSQIRDMVETWFTECVVRRTARLVAAWQSVGFVHGVLNTDNMSITGLTLDYGPYGFMDRYDSQHVSNGSDDGARYSYEAQPGICRWNCERLAEALSSIPLPSAAAAAPAGDTAAAAAAAGAGGEPSNSAAAGGGAGAAGVEGGAAVRSILPGAASRKALAVFDDEYVRMYRAIMRRKLGLLGRTAATAAATAATAAGDTRAAAAGDTPAGHSSNNNPSAAAAAAAAAAGVPVSARPSWPLAADASPQVAAAAAAVAAAPLCPGSGGLDESDDALIADLLTLMEETGADFTNTFRRLALVPMPPPSKSSSSSSDKGDNSGKGDSSSSSSQAAAVAGANGALNAATDGQAPAAAAAANGSGSSSNGSGSSDDEDFGGFLSQQLAELATPSEMFGAHRPSMPLEQLQMLSMLAGRDPATLHMLGINPGLITQQLARHKAAAAWGATTAAAKSSSDAVKWRAWLKRYTQRLRREADEGVPPELRTAVMTASNPRIVLRNWVAQTAIRAAELGHHNTVASLLRLLQQPYSSSIDAALEVPPAVAASAGAAAAAGVGGAAAKAGGRGQGAAAAAAGAAAAEAAVAGGVCPVSVRLQFEGKPPAWAAKLCVTCSS